MKIERTAYSIFCDDIRQEINQKYSLIGCYGGEMIFDALPAILPKLAVNVIVTSPLDRPFEKLIYRIILNGNRDEPMVEFVVPDSDLQKKAANLPDRENAKTIMLNAFFSLASIPFEAESKIAVEVETEDGLLRAGELVIRT
jgi:hypothetical protein